MSSWIESANIYHLYTLNFCGAERFRKDYDNTPGRILKVLEWIPHLVSSNFNAVLFGPLFESSEHGYDTADYFKLDSRLGTNEDFKKVADTLHEHGIRIILDGVFNHVGRDFWAFRDLQEKGQSSLYKDWFAGVNFSGRSPYGDNFSYEGWSGHFNLVKLNLYNNHVVNHLFDAVRQWVSEWGIDGIRFDAADCLTDDFVRRFKSFSRELKDDFWLMGEIIHGNYSRYANPSMFDSVTNYQCHKGIYSSHNDRNYFEISSSFDQQKNQYGNLYLYNFVDNHDVARIATKIKNKAHLPCVYTMLYTMYGVPSVYYGSEFGLEGEKGQGETADLPLRPTLDINNIPGRDDALLAHITKLGHIRRSLDILQTGVYDKVYLNNRTFVYKRELSGKVCYVAFNIDDSDYNFSIKSTTEYWIDCLTGERFKTFNGDVSVTIEPNRSVILVEQHNYTDAFGAIKVKPMVKEIDVTEEIETVEIINEAETTEVIETTVEAIKEAEEAVEIDTAVEIIVETPVQPEPPRKSDIIPLGVKNNRKAVVGGTYKHFKGGVYKILTLGMDHETTAPQVVYLAVGTGDIWVRPLDNFLEEVDDHGNVKERFALAE